MAGEPKTYTDEELDALIKSRIEAETAGLKANQAELLKEAKAAKARLAAYDGVDPEKYRKLEQDAAEAERKRLAGEGDWKSLEAQLLQRHQTEIEKREGRIGQLTKALEQRLVDAEVASVLSELKGSVKGLSPHLKSHIRVVEQDGEFVAQVVDAKGNPRIGDAKGSPMSIKDLALELKNDPELGRLFEGSGSSGGGATKSTGGAGGSPSVIAPSDLMANLEAVATGKVAVQQG